VCGLKEGGGDGLDEEQRVDQPNHRRCAHEQHTEHDENADDVGADHDALAAQSIVDHAGGRRGERAGKHLEHNCECDGLRLAAGEFEQQMIDGESVEPIAQLADNLGEP